jgi:Asp-tRNA(Asn)/Glu-tRNA(Gln) amidotransferase A subunit family amidase
MATKVWSNPNVLSFSRALPDFSTGRCTPREFLEKCVEVIVARDRQVKAFVTLSLDVARKQADAATRRYKSGRPLSRVDGCPVGVKDIITTAEMPTRMNSRVLNWRAGDDAACIAALRRGGAVIIGKTVTTEFAIGRSGPTTNPFDHRRTPGGSSSGSAAAVGCGMVPVALGTQTQGSLLRPASYCGAVGFKPTIGALHTGGIHPLSTTCDHLGVIAGTLADVWRIAFQISVGIPSPRSHLLSAAGPEPPTARKPRKLIRLYTRGWKETDSNTKQAFNEVLMAVKSQDVEITSRDNNPDIANLEDELDRGVDGALSIVAYEMKWPYEGYIARFGKRIGPRIHELIERARQMSPSDYKSLLVSRKRMQDLIRKCSAGCEGFITLAASGPAIPGLAYTGSRTFLTYGSWLGLPAFTLPLMQVNALPVGIQLLGVSGADISLYGIADWMMRELNG